MTLTPIFWSRVLKEHGFRGLLLALGLGFAVSITLYVILYYVIPNYFELPVIVEAICCSVLLLLGLIIFFFLYWKFVVKKS